MARDGNACVRVTERTCGVRRAIAAAAQRLTTLNGAGGA